MGETSRRTSGSPLSATMRSAIAFGTIVAPKAVCNRTRQRSDDLDFSDNFQVDPATGKCCVYGSAHEVVGRRQEQRDAIKRADRDWLGIRFYGEVLGRDEVEFHSRIGSKTNALDRTDTMDQCHFQPGRS